MSLEDMGMPQDASNYIRTFATVSPFGFPYSNLILEGPIRDEKVTYRVLAVFAPRGGRYMMFHKDQGPAASSQIMPWRNRVLELAISVEAMQRIEETELLLAANQGHLNAITSRAGLTYEEGIEFLYEQGGFPLVAVSFVTYAGGDEATVLQYPPIMPAQAALNRLQAVIRSVIEKETIKP